MSYVKKVDFSCLIKINYNFIAFSELALFGPFSNIFLKILFYIGYIDIHIFLQFFLAKIEGAISKKKAKRKTDQIKSRGCSKHSIML